MTATVSNKTIALATATRRASRALQDIDLANRCRMLSLDAPTVDGHLDITMLGRRLRFNPPNFDGTVVATGKPVHPAEHLLLLHYLQHGLPVRPTGEWITFRQFPGGDFYWKPYRTRTADPLVAAIGNDLTLLKSRFNRFDWEPLPLGDMGARIHVLGPIELGLAYHLGDEEFPPEVQVFFDKSLTQILCAEDAAAIASRVCLGLSNQRCSPCSGCSLCDDKK